MFYTLLFVYIFSHLLRRLTLFSLLSAENDLTPFDGKKYIFHVDGIKRKEKYSVANAEEKKNIRM